MMMMLMMLMRIMHEYDDGKRQQWNDLCHGHGNLIHFPLPAMTLRD
jgi:hypothetical protein